MDIPVHSIAALRKGYDEGRWSVKTVAEAVLVRAAAAEAIDPAIWIARVTADELLADAAALDAKGPAGLPLFGVPFAVKDNIDAAGLPTTAACPAFAYRPERSATAVERLRAAGALLLGKTNLDQFATGLVGVRSPYGAPRSPFDTRYISGGSSSGSAVAVSRGLVSFALGTDTAGSGRVPAAFCNVIGLKPSRGLISAAGVVAACQSLDCVSIFATNADDAAAALSAAAGKYRDLMCDIIHPPYTSLYFALMGREKGRVSLNRCCFPRSHMHQTRPDRFWYLWGWNGTNPISR